MSSPITAEYSCSRLSPHITFGTISIKSIISKIENNNNENNLDKNPFIHLKD